MPRPHALKCLHSEKAMNNTNAPAFKIPRCFLIKTILSFILVGAAALLPQSRAADLSLGKTVIASDATAAVKRGIGAPNLGSVEIISVTNQLFSEALRAQTKQRPPHTYSVQIRFPNTAPIRRDDSLLVRFTARSAEATEATTGMVFERASEPFTKSIELDVSVGKEWKPFAFAFRAAEHYEPGQGQLNFRLGYGPQTIDLGGIELLNFGGQIPPDALPSTQFGYAGQEAEALWRTAALERIEQIRKGDLIVRVTGNDGRPMTGIAVSVEMKRHAFGFGSAVAARLIAGPESEDSRRYRETILQFYNRVVFENDLKWPQWENPANRELTLQAARRLREHGIDIRGHCLVWPSWRYVPKDVKGLQNDPPALRKRVNDHILDEAGAMRGLLSEWDVINEPHSNRDLMDVLGDEAMVEWFKLARQADPHAKLYINDYNILAGGGARRGRQDDYEKTIRFLLEQGAPLDGIGMQGHFGQTLTPPAELIQTLDRFAAFGKEIQVTEHDINITDERLQADYTRDFMIAVFSHPSVTGILTWGFWEGRHWRPNGAYFRRDWSVKPAGEVWKELVFTDWWTRASGSTSNNGEYRVRGFHGDYEITITQGEKRRTVRAVLGQEPRVLAIALD
jgi:endo-1,4-beta-xylanase